MTMIQSSVGTRRRRHADQEQDQAPEQEREQAPAPEGQGLTTQPAPSDLAIGAALFRSLGDASRLTILQHLLTGEHRVVDLTDHLGLAQSTVSTHLACLRDCGLVTSRPDGRATQWSLTSPERVVALLTAAEDVLATTGDAVALCPTSGIPR